LIGLLNRKSLNDGEGLFLTSCQSIHMFGMKFAIDAVFLDKSGVVVGILEDFAPGKMSRIFGKAKSCLELPAGTVKKSGTTIGDVISKQKNAD
jgi:uncharacterized protein